MVMVVVDDDGIRMMVVDPVAKSGPDDLSRQHDLTTTTSAPDDLTDKQPEAWPGQA